MPPAAGPPVSGSSPTWPARKTKPLASTTWLNGRFVATIPGPLRTRFGTVGLLSGQVGMESVEPGDAPDAPQHRGIGERVAMDEEEVGGPAFADDARVGLAEELTTTPRRRGQRL